MASATRKIVIAGAGFAGCIVARQLLWHTDAEVVILEKAGPDEWADSGMGLNLNPNGVSAVASLDPALEKALRAQGLPRVRMKAETMTGEPLYDVPLVDDEGHGLALATGLRIRWADAYGVLRAGLPIRYRHEVTGYRVDPARTSGAISVALRDAATGATSLLEGVDLFIGTDGRYSSVREQVAEPEITFIGVCNFRLLVPDTSGGLFDDLDLVYNLAPSPIAHADAEAAEDFAYAASTVPRIGIMVMPQTPSRQQMLYLFGNFGIRDQVPALARTPEGLRALYQPRTGAPSPKCRYILRTLHDHAERLHWARMQYTQPHFGDPAANVLLLGDAAHAIVPTLGQGATLAMEDACVASEILVAAIQDGEPFAGAIMRVATARARRHQFVSDVSNEASEHLMQPGRPAAALMEEEVRAWTDESVGFRRRMRRVWRGGPILAQDFQMGGAHAPRRQRASRG